MVLSLHSHLFLFKRLSPLSKTPNFCSLFYKSFSSLPQSQPQPPPSLSDTQKPSSLSARMSFVFDQIDAIERDRQEKDETLQRIRAWRESKKATTNNDKFCNQNVNSSSLNSVTNFHAEGSVSQGRENEKNGLVSGKEVVELVHPWPEWIELMERLVQQNYFDHKRKDEDTMLESFGYSVGEVAEDGGVDFTRDWKTVETAVLNFGRDRFDILRSLSRQDLQILVGYGCPSTDKRSTFAAKVLRKHVHLDEGDVCSSCSLRSSCERAYLLTNKEDEARTIDVMRILLTYGFDPIDGSVVNKSLLKLKSVKTVVRKLLHEVVKLSAVPIDPNLPPPVIKKPPPKVKQPPPPPRKRVGRDDIEMKKGDWLCPKCDFMNFAKNTVCLQCDAKRPKRQLLPGEWECPQCNFLNYRRNVVCFHCECKRPPDEFMENQLQEKQHGSRMRNEKVSRRQEVSDAWNFNFDDDESDGADVAAFEYADSGKLDEDYRVDKQGLGESSRGYHGYERSGETRMFERDYSSSRPIKSEPGFNDFDDEDDVDNYELDTQNVTQRASRIAFSDLEDSSESDQESLGNSGDVRRRTSFKEGQKSSRSGSHKLAFSKPKDADVDFGSDDDLPIHPNWKSSHVANPRERASDGGSLSFGSDDDLGISSGDEEHMGENFSSQRKRGNNMSSYGRGKDRQGGYRTRPLSDDYDDDDDDDDLGYHMGKETGRSRINSSMRGGPRSQGCVRSRPLSDTDDDSIDFHRVKGTRGSRRNISMRGDPRGRKGQSFEKNFGDSRRVRDYSKGNAKNSLDMQRSNGRKGNSQSFGGSPARGSYNQQRGKSNDRDNRSDSYYDDDRFKRPRVNVR